MNTYTATFSNGTTLQRNSRTKVYTHAWLAMSGGEYPQKGFATDLEKARKEAKSAAAYLIRTGGSESSITIEIVPTAS